MPGESDTEMTEAPPATYEISKAIYSEACEPFNKLAQNCNDVEAWKTLHRLNKKIKEQNQKDNVAEDLYTIKIETFKAYFKNSARLLNQTMSGPTNEDGKAEYDRAVAELSRQDEALQQFIAREGYPMDWFHPFAPTPSSKAER